MEPRGVLEKRDRLLTSEVTQQFFAEVNKHARRFMSDEHFTVDVLNAVSCAGEYSG
jgi:hypothetical protein